MRLFFRNFLLAASCALLGACGTLSGPLPVAEVVRLSKEGASPQRVTDTVKKSRTVYALRGSDIGVLAARGVAPEVLDQLQQAFVANVDMLTRFDALGESYGGCDICYPQRLDLASLERGGDGMAPPTNLARRTTFARPQGVPEWVPAAPAGAGSETFGIGEVEGWHRQGVGADELARRVRAGRFMPIIESEGALSGKVTSRFKPGLRGSQLAALARQGVPGEVLDAVQESFLAGYVDFTSAFYRNWGKGVRP